MKRIQLFEFEDFKWFPSIFRIGMTKLLVVFHKMFGTAEVLTKLLKEIRLKVGFDQIVDLGSGSGGAMIEIEKRLNTSEPTVQFILTDLYPDPDFVKRFNDKTLPNITYETQPLDATNLEHAPTGLKTMFNSFHHMPPVQAKQILSSAQLNQQPLLIYELSENYVPTLVWWLLLPLSLVILFLMALFMTPFVKGLTWQQLLFTYLIPIIPLAYAWDGQASLMRIYTFKDIEGMLSDFKNDSYTWEINPLIKENGKKLGYYVLGSPMA